MNTKLLKRPKSGNHEEGPRIAHIRDWEVYSATGELKGLCGTRLKGRPAVGYRDCCVVCLTLADSRGFTLR